MTPLPAKKALDDFYLEARCKILDLAAILDRISRGPNGSGLTADRRLEAIQKALEALQDDSPGRAERIQQIFSLPYDPSWERPRPRF
jgi:hypothetical protein